MNRARVVSLALACGGSGRCGGNRPSTATPCILLSGRFSKMHALNAPVHRIAACTMRWNKLVARHALPQRLHHVVHEIDDDLLFLGELVVSPLPAGPPGRAPSC